MSAGAPCIGGVQDDGDPDQHECRGLERRDLLAEEKDGQKELARRRDVLKNPDGRESQSSGGRRECHEGEDRDHAAGDEQEVGPEIDFQKTRVTPSGQEELQGEHEGQEEHHLDRRRLRLMV